MATKVKHTTEKHEEERTNDRKNTSLPQRMYRVDHNKVIGGVAGGLGEYFGIDPTIIRVLFVFLAIFGGSGIILYLILWAVIPSQANINKSGSDAIKANVEEMKLKAKGTADSLSSQDESGNRSFWATILIVIGILFLINNYGIFDINLGELWPLLLIVLGLLILRRK